MTAVCLLDTGFSLLSLSLLDIVIHVQIFFTAYLSISSVILNSRYLARTLCLIPWDHLLNVHRKLEDWPRNFLFDSACLFSWTRLTCVDPSLQTQQSAARALPRTNRLPQNRADVLLYCSLCMYNTLIIILQLFFLCGSEVDITSNPITSQFDEHITLCKDAW